MPIALLFLVTNACTRHADQDLYLRALDPTTSDAGALGACQAMNAGEARDECTASVIRQREMTGLECSRISTSKWYEECWFSVGERQAALGRRWEALEGCGRAGRFMDECLYHAWTCELQAIVVTSASDDLVSTVERARDTVAFFGQVETAGPGQEDRVWADFWYSYYWLNHRPAALEGCDALIPSDQASCRIGTESFVERAVSEKLHASQSEKDLKDRSCRGGALPDAVLSELFVRNPVLAAAAARALARACSSGSSQSRPWNPIFQPRRPR